MASIHPVMDQGRLTRWKLVASPWTLRVLSVRGVDSLQGDSCAEVLCLISLQSLAGMNDRNEGWANGLVESDSAGQGSRRGKSTAVLSMEIHLTAA